MHFEHVKSTLPIIIPHQEEDVGSKQSTLGFQLGKNQSRFGYFEILDKILKSLLNFFYIYKIKIFLHQL